MISIFVFVLGSLFVVTQLATNIHSNRSSLLMLEDMRVQQAVARPLVLALATLLLALVAPDQDVSDAGAAFALTLMAATAFTLGNAAALLPTLISQVTAPRNFALYVLEPVSMFMSLDATGAIVWRVGALGEMLKRGVRSGDSLQLKAALSGLDEFHIKYVTASQVIPAVRTHQYEGSRSVGWLGEELVPVLVSAGQDGIALDIPEINRISSSLAGFSVRSAEAGHREEFFRAVDGLGELATSTQQVKFPGMTNHIAESVFGLAACVAAAQTNLDDDAAAAALAVWALAVAYAMRYLGAGVTSSRHSQWTNSLGRFGPEAPFEEAHDVVDSPSFRHSWANKLPAIPQEFDFSGPEPTPTGRLGGPDGLHAVLDDASLEA